VPNLRLILTDGREVRVRFYAIQDEVVKLTLADGSGQETARETIDLEATLAANSGVDFDPPPTPPAPGEAVLELVSRNEQETGDYLLVEGLVRNLSRADLHGVVAKVQGEDAQDGFVTCEESLIDWNPLRSRAESPFRVVLKAGGKVRRTRLQFRALLGDELPTLGLEQDD